MVNVESSEIRFRELRLTDLALMHRWLNSDALARWYNKRKPSIEEVEAKYTPRIMGREPTRCFLILHDEKPIGYVQSYRVQDYPDYNRQVQADPSVVGLDIFIGEPDFLHRGYGTMSMTKFLKDVVFTDPEVKSCVVDPEPNNKAAIRAYEKVGFRYWKTIQITGESAPKYAMRIRKHDLV